MKRLFMNVLLASSMAVGSAAFASNVQAKETAPLIVTVSKADLSDIMDMKVVDQKGKKVSLKDLIAENDVTLLNFWGTFCSPCTEEMPILDKLAKKYEDEGFGVIGLCVDVADEKGKLDKDELEAVDDILDTTKVTYPIVYPMPNMQAKLKLGIFPTTYFVDKKGNAITDAIYGSKDSEGWEKEIKSCLKKVK